MWPAKTPGIVLSFSCGEFYQLLVYLIFIPINDSFLELDSEAVNCGAGRLKMFVAIDSSTLFIWNKTRCQWSQRHFVESHTEVTSCQSGYATSLLVVLGPLVVAIVTEPL